MKLLKLRPGITTLLKRYLCETTSTTSTTATVIKPRIHKEQMNAWTIPTFGGLESLKFTDDVAAPLIRHHKDVMVKVLATSVNPLDVEMVEGYGHVLLGLMRQCNNLVSNSESSEGCVLIPGRDFAGEVIAKASGVRNDVKVGQQVYGVVPAHLQGCHAEMVVVSDSMVRPVPAGRSLIGAAALMYTGMTAWSALCITGDLLWTKREDKNVLVIGASGGIGSLAVQMLKSWKCKVVATCRTDAVPVVETLGADVVIDYTTPDALRKIESSGKYDIIFDAAGNVTHYTYIPFLKEWSNSKYITLRSPLLQNTDQFGLVGGMMKNAAELVRSNIVSGAPTKGASIRWAYFLPLENAVDDLHHMYETQKISPLVCKLFSFKDLPLAYQKVRSGHNRGKVVISMTDPKLEKSLESMKITPVCY